MPDISTQATVNIEVNSQSVKRRLAELENQLSDLNKKKAEFERTGNTAGLVKIEKEIKNVNRQMNTARTNAQKCEAALQKLNSASPKELRMVLKQLQNDLNHIERGSAAWNRHVEAIKRVKRELDTVNAEMRESESLTQRIGRGMSNWGMSIAGAAAAFTGLVFSARQAVEAYAQMEAEMANVRKFTGMTAEQVEELNEEFKKMDTRTSREGLNQLAQEAGRLGLQSKEDVLGYVKAADQINVALDDLGEGATLTLSKLTDIFGDRERLGVEQSLLSVGSVINELSQNCSASAPYLAEFASQLGGTGVRAGMSIQQIMAYGAVLDSAKQNVESSSTALSQLIVKLYRDPAKYAEAAGLDVKKFTELLKTDANEAVLTLLDTLNKAGGLDVLAPMFAEMGEKGSRSVQTLSVLAAKIDDVRAQQEVANRAFDEGTSVTKEYNIQNNTVQAGLEKAKNDFHEMAGELGQKLAPAMKYAIQGTKALMSAMSTIITFAGQHKKAVVTLTAAIAGYTVALKGAAIATAVQNGLEKISIALKTAWSAVTGLATAAGHLFSAAMAAMSGNMVVAKAEMAAFNAVCAANPIGAVVVAIMAAVTALGLFNSATDEAVQTQDALSQAQENGIKTKEKEKLILDENIKRIKNFNGTKAEEQRLVNELNNKYGPVLGTYKTLAQWLDTLKTKGDKYVNTVYQQILVEGKLEKARQYIAKAARIREQKGVYDDADFLKNLWNYLGEEGGYIFRGDAKSWDTWKQDRRDAYDNNLENMAKEYEKAAEQLTQEAQRDAAKYGIVIPGVIGDTTTTVVTEPTVPPPGGDGGSGNKRTGRSGTGNTQKTPEEKRRAEIKKIKESAEYKKDLMAIEADMKKTVGKNTAEYYAETITYEQMLDSNFKATEKFYKDKNDLYAKYGINDDAEGIKKMNDEKVKAEKSYYDAKLKLELDHLKETKEAEQRALEERTLDPKDEMFHDQDALDKAKELSEKSYLENVVKLHKKYNKLKKEVSKESLAAEQALTKANEDWKLKHKQDLDKKLQQWLAVYDKQNAQKRMETELAILKEAYTQKLVDEKQYQAAKRAIEDKYRHEVDTATGTQTLDGKHADALSDHENQMLALEIYHAAGLVSEEEYQQRKAEIVRNYDNKIAAMIKEDGEKWSGLVSDLFFNWKDLLTNFTGDWRDALKAIGSAAAATFAMMNAGLEVYSAYADAEFKLEEARIKASTDLEKNKEDKIRALKTKANKKAMKIEIAQAIASTALGAINAFASAAKAPWPLGMILGPIAAGMAIAAGAIQISTIKKQHQAEEIGYYDGGFTSRDGNNHREAGVVHANEFVANHKAVSNPQLLPVLRLIDQAQRNNTVGSLTREDVSRAIGQGAILGDMTVAQQRTAEQHDTSMVMVAASMERQTDAINELNARLADGIESFMVMDGERGFDRSWERYQRMKNNPKR